MYGLKPCILDRWYGVNVLNSVQGKVLEETSKSESLT